MKIANKTTVDFGYLRYVDLRTPLLTNIPHGIASSAGRKNAQNRSALGYNWIPNRANMGIQQCFLLRIVFTVVFIEKICFGSLPLTNDQQMIFGKTPELVRRFSKMKCRSLPGWLC